LNDDPSQADKDRTGQPVRSFRAPMLHPSRIAAHCAAMVAAKGIPMPDPNPTPDAPAKDHEEDLIDEGLEESFPASDPPAVPRFD
jgi:hypothetical protein